ncbi:MAG TPA: hypothetical protein PLG17_12165 [Thermodesulfobacteriota bacterium]|nr:hypothetical protein [Deltaproteobacteria bacterium]HNR14078.1 hypothetical protein [Thermodesulfobacteriota bacterium]HNU72999.1 hypothetical protein [Thermodesulfobacteriota bacterium]HQO79251.1 hypothetical protein [Thermodesulfobacteriota bacterium]
MRLTGNLESPLFITTVLIALALVAVITPVIPGVKNTFPVIYSILLFLVTMSMVVLLYFAATLVLSGVQRLYHLVKLLRSLRRQRPEEP